MTPPGWPAALILDVDGTMYAQRRVRVGMLVRLARHAAAHPLSGWRSIAVVRAYRHAQEAIRLAPGGGAARGEQLRAAARAAGVDEAAAARHIERWMHAEPLALLPRAVRPGLVDFLTAARARGIRIGVFSDYPAESKLVALGIRALVDAVRSAHDDERGRFKPDPAGLLDVAAALGVEPSESVYVGDRPEVDAAAAERAGMRCFIIAAPHPGGAAWTAVDGFPALHHALFPPAS